MNFDDQHLRPDATPDLPTDPRWLVANAPEDGDLSAFVATTTFTTAATAGQLHITARGRYRLFVNDQPVGVGPIRGTKAIAFVDTYDLADLLSAGEDTLRIEAVAPRNGSFRIPATRAAVWVRLDVADTEQPEWSIAARPEFQTHTGQYTIQLGPYEVRDWQVPPADASPAQLVNLPGVSLKPRDIGPLPIMERPVTEVDAHYRVEPRQEAADIAAGMDADVFAHSSGTSALPLRIESDGHDHVLMLDGQTAFTEGIVLDIDAPAGTIVDVGYGETIEPNGRPQLRTERYHFADRWVLADGRRTYGPAAFERGGRWVQLTFRNITGPVMLHAATVLDRRHPLDPPPRPAWLEGPSAAVFDACVETLHACAIDTFIDCPRRESALWVNDMMVQVPAWLAAGGDPALVRRSLDLAFAHRLPCGLVSAVVPGPDNDKFAFPGTNAWLAVMVEQFHEATDEDDTVRRWLPHLREVRQLLERWRDTDGPSAGLIRPPAEIWNFIDWSVDLAEGRPVAQAMSQIGWFDVLGLDAHARLERRFGDAALADRLETDAANVARRVHETCWDDTAGGYREAAPPAEKPFDTKRSKISAALAWLSGRVPADEMQRCLDALDDPEARTPELYLHHFLFEAWRRADRHDRIDAAVARYWQPMVDAGYPTIWETNVVQDAIAAQDTGCSLCHAFAVAPLGHWLAVGADEAAGLATAIGAGR